MGSSINAFLAIEVEYSDGAVYSNAFEDGKTSYN